jgi:flavin reductase (DIM6/NTAB) family NADH-FMN oxidoreductase RutF
MRFDLDPRRPEISYKLLTACVTPRPIAWVTSLSAAGVVNAAPYSFFNAMGHRPPTVTIGILADPEKGWKDTARNILDSGEFVINLVTEALADQMNLTCMNAPAELSEIEIAGLGTTPASQVAPPLIAEAPVSLECRTHTVVTTGQHQAIVVGQVLAIHVADRYVLDAERGHIDSPGLALIGRIHGAGWYSRSGDQFQLTRPTFEAWQRGERD